MVAWGRNGCRLEDGSHGTHGEARVLFESIHLVQLSLGSGERYPGGARKVLDRKVCVQCSFPSFSQKVFCRERVVCVYIYKYIYIYIFFFFFFEPPWSRIFIPPPIFYMVLAPRRVFSGLGVGGWRCMKFGPVGLKSSERKETDTTTHANPTLEMHAFLLSLFVCHSLSTQTLPTEKNLGGLISVKITAWLPTKMFPESFLPRLPKFSAKLLKLFCSCGRYWSIDIVAGQDICQFCVKLNDSRPRNSIPRCLKF